MEQQLFQKFASCWIISKIEEDLEAGERHGKKFVLSQVEKNLSAGFHI